MTSEELFKAKIVQLIITRRTEEALNSLSRFYSVDEVDLRVGIPKGHIKVAGCYVSSKKTIFVSNADFLYNPYVILHEFYHHLRTHNAEHRGTEKHADRFANDFVEAYRGINQVLEKDFVRKALTNERTEC